MNKRVTFVASLFVVALCGYVGGGIQLYQYLEIETTAQTSLAAMRYDDPEPVDTLGSGGRTRYKYFLQFPDESGTLIYGFRYVTASEQSVLTAGGEIPILFLPQDPNRRIVREGPTTAILVLLGALIATAVAILAWRMLRREAEQD